MKFPGYFLIVADFIKWAKDHDIPVGPGRGSGAGSLVAYALTITDLDPLRFGLLFERFLNPERVSMPDFDIDFCQSSGRERGDRLRAAALRRGPGRARSSRSARCWRAACCATSGRVLEMPYGQVDKLTQAGAPEPGQSGHARHRRSRASRSCQTAVDEEPDRRAHARASRRSSKASPPRLDPRGRRRDRRPARCRNSCRSTAIRRPACAATQFNMKWVEQAGLVKFDFLGLKTLTVLRTAVDLIRRKRGIEIDLSALPLDDPKTYEMLRRGETVGVFQVESAGMRKALVEMRGRPLRGHHRARRALPSGPDGQHPGLLRAQARQGRAQQEDWYPHPKLEPILRETFGIIVYQEQVMQIAQILSGYSLGDADLLRRAMGKKIKAEMDAQRERFVSGAVERGLDKAQGRRDLRPAREVRRLRLQQEPRRRLCAGRLPDRLSQGEPPGRVPRRVDDARYRQHRQARGIPPRGAAPRHQGRAALDQPLRRRLRCRYDARDGAIRYALAAVKGVGRQAIEALVEARGRRALPRPRRFRPPHQPARRSTSARSKA